MQFLPSWRCVCSPILFGSRWEGSKSYIFQFRWISKDFAEVKKLKRAYIAKAIIAGVQILLSIGFAIALYQGGRHDNERATFVAGTFLVLDLQLHFSLRRLQSLLLRSSRIGVLEWVIAFGFILYLLTFYFDLRMSKGMQKGDLNKEKLVAMQNNGTLAHNGHINGPGELADDGGYGVGRV